MIAVLEMPVEIQKNIQFGAFIGSKDNGTNGVYLEFLTEKTGTMKLKMEIPPSPSADVIGAIRA